MACGGARPAACTQGPALDLAVEGASAVDVGAIVTREIGDVPSGPRARRHVAEALARAERSVSKAYADAGYAAASMAPARIELSQDRARLEVSLTVHEGPVFHVASVSVLDADADAGELPGAREALAMLEVGERFDPARAARVAALLRDACREVGYGACDVGPSTALDEEHARLDLELQVARGPRYVIDAIDELDEIAGRVPLDPALASVPLGAPYRGSIVDRARREVEAAHPDRRVSFALVPSTREDAEAHAILRVLLVSP